MYTAGGSERKRIKEADPELYNLVEQKLEQAKGALPQYKEPEIFEPEEMKPLSQEEARAGRKIMAPHLFFDSLLALGNALSEVECIGTTCGVERHDVRLEVGRGGFDFHRSIVRA